MTVREKREKRVGLAVEMRKFHDDHQKDWTSECEERWQRYNVDIASLKAEIDREEALEKLERAADDHPALEPDPIDYRNSEPGDEPASATIPASEPDAEARNAMFYIWMCQQQGVQARQEAAKICRKYNFDPRRPYFDVSLRRDYRQVHEARQMSTVAGAGGDTIPAGFQNGYEVSQLAYGGMRQVSTILRTETGNDLPYPTTNDTTSSGELLDENATAASLAIATGNVTFHAYKYSSKVCLVSNELLEDTAFDMPTILGGQLGTRIGRITNNHFTVGTGISQPKGIMLAATGVTADSVSAITTDELISLVHSVDPAYRVRGESGWMMNDATLAVIRKLKEATTNQYLWQPGLQVGVPDMLFGYPVTINQDCASIAAAADVIAFGNMKKYLIRDVAMIRVRRLVERYADNDQEGYVVFSRHDGDILDAGTDPIKTLTMAAS